MLPTRALENHVWLAYANLAPPQFYGQSRIVGSDDEESARVENARLITADLVPRNCLRAILETPYLADRRPMLYHSIHDLKYHVQLPIAIIDMGMTNRDAQIRPEEIRCFHRSSVISCVSHRRHRIRTDFKRRTLNGCTEVCREKTP